jgi:hypothetical protein
VIALLLLEADVVPSSSDLVGSGTSNPWWQPLGVAAVDFASVQ